MVEHLKPILYESTEKTFFTNGIGVLSDVLSCIVEEEKNGAYELTMEYPVGGAHFYELISRAIILAKPNNSDRPQPFRIYQIGKPLNGIVTVCGQHISYDLSGVAVAPFSATGIDNVIAAMQANAIPSDHGFILTTNEAGGTGIMTDVPGSFRALMGGTDGSLLDIYGGEYKYDRFSISLLSARGRDRGFEIRYGKNLISFGQEENCASVYTDVYPFWVSGDERVFLDEKTIRASGTYNFTKVLPLDMSSYFDSAPSKADLKAAAQNYMTVNKIGVPKVSLKLSYEDFAENQNAVVELCDTVTVVFPKLNVRTKAQIVKVEYDVLLERYKSLEIGSTVSSLAETIADNTVDISKILRAPSLQQAIANATAWLTRTTGGHIVFKKDANGGFSEIYIMDTDDVETARKVWRINLGGFGFSGNGVNGPYETAITQDGQIVGSFVTAEGLQVNAANILGLLQASQINAEGLQVNAANILGLLQASQIDADDLHVKSANIDGTITADAINLNSASITGTLSASYIDADNLHVKSANIDGDIHADSIYANKIIGGSVGGYVASGAISDAGHTLSELYVSDFTANAASVGTTVRIGGVGSNVTIGGAKVTLVSSGGTTEKMWADILAGTGSAAVFG